MILIFIVLPLGRIQSSLRINLQNEFFIVSEVEL